MPARNVDIAIVGAGFAGSLVALIANKLGFDCVLIERGRHPRFTIGESSTPIANLVLKSLCDRYGLPKIAPLTKYGTWCDQYREIQRGLKRGFSYFHHREKEAFAPRADHANELLVAANPSDIEGDTHWFREDVDAFFVKQVEAAGVSYYDRTQVQLSKSAEGWRLWTKRDGSLFEMNARLLIDASGAGGAIGHALGLAHASKQFRTNSSTLYSHFTGVAKWGDVYAGLGGNVKDHPFDCDAAALHHLFDGGWMWVLRFDNGITSAGFVWDDRLWPDEAALVRHSPDRAWSRWLNRFPGIADQFAASTPVQPWQSTPKLQRMFCPTAGPDWVMLPFSACFLDPLHSTGIALTLVAIERIASALEHVGISPALSHEFQVYDQKLSREVDLLDRLVHGCYLGFENFALMRWYATLYFAAATTCEENRINNPHGGDLGFLLSADPRYCDAITQAYDLISKLASRKECSAADVQGFKTEICRWIEPFDTVGLRNPAIANMYPYV